MSQETKIARRIRIEGRVQGVFFRDSIRSLASRLGVYGWVRNLPDGAVLAHLEGSPEPVGKVIDFCHEGPPAARVDRILVEDAEVYGHTDFRILG